MYKQEILILYSFSFIPTIYIGIKAYRNSHKEKILTSKNLHSLFIILLFIFFFFISIYC